MKTYKTLIPKFTLVREKTSIPKIKVNSSDVVAKYAYDLYEDDIDIMETFFVIFVNNALNTIGYHMLSKGALTGTVVDNRLVGKYALETLATGIVLVHNHPSGALKPSYSDKEITKKLIKMLSYHDVKVVDHVILTPEKGVFYSMADNNELN